MSILGNLKENFEREKAKLQGKARSHARMVKTASEIDGVRQHLNGANGNTVVGAPTPIKGAVVRMLDGKPMIFHTDGSLRHALGRATTKAARKQLKKARRNSRVAVSRAGSVEIKRVLET
jgi:hypothetical protein